MTDIKFAYKGEAMLLRWNTNHKGKTITLELHPSDCGERHPFEGLPCGDKNGQRMKLAVVLTDEHEQPVPPPTPATQAPQVGTKDEQSQGDEAKEKKRFRELKRSAQAAMMLTRPEFRIWLCGRDVDPHFADAKLKGRLFIVSKTALDQVVDRANEWDRLLDTYEVETKWQR